MAGIKIESAILKDHLDSLDMTPQDWGVKHGLSRTAASTWLKKGEMPKWVLSLIRSDGCNRVLVVRGPAKKLEIVKSLAENLDLQVS